MSARSPRILSSSVRCWQARSRPQRKAGWSRPRRHGQFRGPAQAHADDAKIPLTWSETEHVKWKTALPGEGWSSPVVAGGPDLDDHGARRRQIPPRPVLQSSNGPARHRCRSIQKRGPTPKHDRNSYASPTPIIDGDRLYVHFGPMGTACLSTSDGRKIWENRELKIDHQNGPGGSPALYKEKLLIDCDGMDFQYGVALDKYTGKIAWKTERSAIPKLAQRPPDRRKAYGTPVILNVDGRPEALSTGAERLYSADPETGKELWSVDYPGTFPTRAPATGQRRQTRLRLHGFRPPGDLGHPARRRAGRCDSQPRGLEATRRSARSQSTPGGRRRSHLHDHRSAAFSRA